MKHIHNLGQIVGLIGETFREKVSTETSTNQQPFIKFVNPFQYQAIVLHSNYSTAQRQCRERSGVTVE